MKKTLKEDVERNQDLTLKPLYTISNSEAMKRLDKYNLLPWLNKKLENIYGKENLSKKNQAEKQPVEKVAKQPISVKKPDENQKDTNNVEKFHNSPAGKALKAEIAKKAEIQESLLKAMYADSLKKAQRKEFLRMAKRLAQKRKDELAKEKLNRAWEKYYQHQAQVQTEKLNRTPELSHSHLVNAPEYRLTKEEFELQMSNLQGEMQALHEEIISLQETHLTTINNHLAIQNGLLKTGDFLFDIEDLSPEERLTALTEEHARLTNKVAVKMQASEPVDPAKMQMMQLRLIALNQEMQLANEQLKKINPAPVFRPEQDLNNLPEEAKEQTEKHVEKQKLGFKHVWHAFCKHREQKEAAFDQKLKACLDKHEKCYESMQLLKAKTNVAINDLVANNPELNPVPGMKPVPIQVSTTKLSVNPSMSPTPEPAFKRYKEEWCSFFANRNLTKNELLEQVDKQLPIVMRDYAKNFINQALAGLRPQDRISPQVMEELQNTAPSPFRRTPRPISG